MINKWLFACVALALLCVANGASAQQTNAGEDYSAYLPEVRAANQYLAKMPQSGSLLTKEGLAAARAGIPTAQVTPPPAVRFLPRPGGKVGVRIFRPDTVRAVVMSIHGGGWTAGTAASDDSFNEYLSRTCKVAVVAVDYRLAPENPFPACIDDCKAVAQWLIGSGLKELGASKLFISGASAGGHLAAVTTLYIRDSLHAIGMVGGVNLIYGCFDLSRTPSNQRATDSTLMIPKKYIDEVYQLVFPGWSKERLRDPQYSPLYADLKNLPPALFTVGTVDPLVDDTYFLEARWRLAGNRTYLATYPESPHAFNYFPTRMAAAANKRMCDWIISLSGQ